MLDWDKGGDVPHETLLVLSEAGSTIHEKDSSLVDRVDHMETIEGNIADVGQQQFQIFQSMQRVRLAADSASHPADDISCAEPQAP